MPLFLALLLLPNPLGQIRGVFSFDLRFQAVKLLRGEKLAQGNVKAVTQFLEGQKFGIIAFPVQDILHRGRRQS